MGISRRELRRYLLAYQGLYPPRGRSGAEGVLSIFRHLRCIQFDPIDVVGRNHEIVLQARVSGFRRDHLTKLLYDDRFLVEGWDKQMSIGPMEDRPYFAYSRREAAGHHRFKEEGPLADMLQTVREEIRRRGPISSLDIQNDEQLDWSWAPARTVRAAMEALWFRGELMIHHRRGTRRYYDLTERVLSEKNSDPLRRFAGNIDPEPGVSDWPPSAAEVLHNVESRRQWRVVRRISSAGALCASSGDGWLGIDITTGDRRRSIASLCEQGMLEAVDVQGLSEPVYRLVDDGGVWQNFQNGPVTPKAAVIAPLDNLIWDRALIRQVFNFDYVWEVYKPKSMRRWGYYVLPVIYGDRFIARFEPARDNRNGEMVIKNWWPEPGVRSSAAMADSVGVALRALAKSNGLTGIRLVGSSSGCPMLSRIVG